MLLLQNNILGQISANAFVVSNYNGSQITCFGVCDAVVSVSFSGGTAPYSFQWSNFQNSTSQTVSGLCQGTYAVTVTDAVFTSTVTSVVVVQPNVISVLTNSNDATTCISNNGTVSAVAFSGTGPMAYQWSNGTTAFPSATTGTITGLPVGTYNLTVTDANNCSITGSEIIGCPAFLPVDADDSLQLLKLCWGLGGNSGPPFTAIQRWNQALSSTNRQWQPANPIRNWYGVTLVSDGDTMRVAKVDLGDFNLFSGPTAGDTLFNNLSVLQTQQLNNLDSLFELHLDSSGLMGNMVNIWGINNGIKYIDISGSHFIYSATFFQALFGTLNTIRTVKARAAFDRSTTLVLPLSIPSLSFNLEVLDIGKNGFLGTIPDFSSFLQSLKEGYFDENSFDSIALNSTNSTLSILDISKNKFGNPGCIYKSFAYARNLTLLKANNSLDTASATFVFSPTIPMVSILDKVVEMRANNFIGTFDLNYFSSGTGTKTLDIAFNQIDSLVLFTQLPQINIQKLDFSNNRVRNILSENLLNAYEFIEYLYINNNQISGELPAPTGPSSYTWRLLKELNLSHNPGIKGALRLDWMFNSQTTPILEKLNISDNDFNNIVPSIAQFSNLKGLKVDRNRFHFDDLYNLVRQFGMPQVNFNNAGVTTSQYIPPYWLNAGAVLPDTLSSFIYFPQDSAGIGGVRRRPHGDSVVFVTNVGYPENIVHNVIWYRDSSSVSEIMGDVEAFNNNGALQLGNVVPTLTASGVTVAPDSIAHMIKIINLDSSSHTKWFIRAETKHDSFPLLSIPVRAKKLIVGQCYDDFGGVTICQQMVVQFRDTVGYEGKLRIRGEFGINVLDSCVCGAIELWGFPDTLNQVEMEQLGTGTRSSSSQANSKAELLSADPNYSLLGNSSGPNGARPNFTNGNTESNPTLVAFVDSGVDFDNSYLRKRLWVNQEETNNNGLDDDNDCEIDNGWGWNYLDRNNNTFDDHGHGTAVASILGGYSSLNYAYNNGNNDVLGLIPYKYTDKTGRGTVFHAACGLLHAANYRDTLNNGQVAAVRVINASWGYYGEPCMVLENAIIKTANLCDVLIVTSAGNDGLNTELAKHWPSNSPFVPDSTLTYVNNILAVAALSQNDSNQLANYSNFSSKHIDIASVGTTYTFTPSDSVLILKNGTSFSSAQVSRIAGLLFHEFPNASSGAVKFALMNGVDTLQSADSLKIKSGGRLNYQKARNILSNLLDYTLCDESSFVVSAKQIADNKISAAVKIYPNPFTQNLNIEFDNGSAVLDEQQLIQITDITGRLVLEHKICSQSLYSIDVSDLSAGIYFISIIQGSNKYVGKVIKQ